MRLREAEVVDRERFGDHALLRLRWSGVAPEPGQFVMARAAAGRDPFLGRPLFAHDYDGERLLSLLFEIRGRGTALLAESDVLLVGELVGHGFSLDGSLDGPVALLGGGVWVSPLKLLHRRLAEAGVAHDIYLEVPAAAHAGYATFLTGAFSGATLVPTEGTDEDEAAQDFLGRVGDLSRYSALYASGPAGMLAAVKTASEGVVHAQIAVRERMACANGSCYGCAVPVWSGGERTYARACVEGPVFGAEEVVELRR